MEANPAVDALFRLSGVDASVALVAERRLAGRLAGAAMLGVTIDDLAVVGQAYIRAVGRVVAAEAQIISAIKGVGDGDDSVRQALIAAAQALGRDTFALLHDATLSKALGSGASPFNRRQAGDQPVAVAHVDVVSSTALLAAASPGETQRLVDGLFTSAQSAIRSRPVVAIKYVGDGVFLAGSDAGEVMAAALDCLQRLSDEFGFAARAGLACGPVVHRAGDIFGLVVNLAHALTKAAPPGAAGPEEAARNLPGVTCSEPLAIAIAGLPSDLMVVEVTGVGPDTPVVRRLLMSST